MARQVIKATSDRLKTIQEGLQTCLIHRNDRLWTTYDEIWFAECDKNEHTTGEGHPCPRHPHFVLARCSGLRRLRR